MTPTSSPQTSSTPTTTSITSSSVSISSLYSGPVKKGNFISVISTKLTSTSTNIYKEILVTEFSTFRTTTVSTKESCAILCHKDTQNVCTGFRVFEAIGTITCSFGNYGLTETDGTIAIYVEY
jgi:hypothetical protein